LNINNECSLHLFVLAGPGFGCYSGPASADLRNRLPICQSNTGKIWCDNFVKLNIQTRDQELLLWHWRISVHQDNGIMNDPASVAISAATGPITRPRLESMYLRSSFMQVETVENVEAL